MSRHARRRRAPKILAAAVGAGITTLAEVRRHRPEELTALHGVGPKAISVLRTALAERGWTFADAEDG